MEKSDGDEGEELCLWLTDRKIALVKSVIMERVVVVIGVKVVWKGSFLLTL